MSSSLTSFFSIGLPEAAFLVANISKIYAPELTVGYTAVRMAYPVLTVSILNCLEL